MITQHTKIGTEEAEVDIEVQFATLAVYGLFLSLPAMARTIAINDMFCLNYEDGTHLSFEITPKIVSIARTNWMVGRTIGELQVLRQARRKVFQSMNWCTPEAQAVEEEMRIIGEQIEALTKLQQPLMD